MMMDRDMNLECDHLEITIPVVDIDHVHVQRLDPDHDLEIKDIIETQETQETQEIEREDKRRP